MANFLYSIPSPNPILFFFFYLCFFFTAEAAAAARDAEASFVQSQKTWRRPLREKMSHLRFYWHDIYSGTKPTAVVVATAAAPTNASSTLFGMVSVIDDPLTVAPKLSSRLVGRAQGFYASTSKEEIALLVAMNFAFVEGRFNGSTIAVLGRNAVFSGVREMPVVGGSGVFRFARGYVQARTYSINLKTGDAVVEYNVFVTHY